MAFQPAILPSLNFFLQRSYPSNLEVAGVLKSGSLPSKALSLERVMTLSPVAFVGQPFSSIVRKTFSRFVSYD